MGLHSGASVTVQLHPSTNGIRFFDGQVWVDASPANVTDTTRSTRLGQIGTVEHLMSALAGCEISDVDVVVTGGEMPALDGAASEYVSRLVEAGFEQVGFLEVLGPFARVFTHDANASVAVAKGSGHWTYRFVNEERWPYRQEVEFGDISGAYSAEIAPARTWGFESELPALQAAGLAQGLSLDQALVLGSSGYVNEARFPDEPTRHKMLDLIGDLYLSGVPIRALSVVAERSGHKLNVEAAARLAASVSISRG